MALSPISLVQKLTLLAAVLCVGSVATGQNSLTWSGQWQNRKYGTSGPLKCVARETKPGQWSATFTGTFKGDPFQYKANFQSRAGRQGLELSGQSTVSGHRYQWTGGMSATQFRIKYRNRIGYNGDFVLKGRNKNFPAPGDSVSKEPKSPGSADRTPEKPRGGSWDPMIKQRERLLFVGNSYMANEGGLHNYVTKALRKSKYEIVTDQAVFFGKPLKEMWQPATTRKISRNFDSVVITSGDLESMRRFDSAIRKSGKKTIIFMTWEGRHPGNQSSAEQYTAATRRAVGLLRELESQTGAIVVPSAVVFHDLTVRPPQGVPRVDYLWKPRDIHQNELGTMINAWTMYAVLTGKSPAGVNFDMSPYIVGQRVQSDPQTRLTRRLRGELQKRVWEVVQAWRGGKCHLE